jgi:hypothetical protein
VFLLLLLSGCGPVLFTVAGHNVTVGGVIVTNSIKHVIKEEKKGKL